MKRAMFKYIILLLILSAPIHAFADGRDYRIGSENLLQIDVHYGKDGVISQKVRVSSKGLITFPLIGEVVAKDLTVSELEKKLYTLLEKDYLVNPQVSVVIEEYSTVSVIGQVTKPGSYPLKGRLSVLEAISLAEGFTKIAAPNSVKVIRTNPDGSKTEISVRVGDIMKGKNEKENIYLHGGDVVVVPESLF